MFESYQCWLPLRITNLFQTKLTELLDAVTVIDGRLSDDTFVKAIVKAVSFNHSGCDYSLTLSNTQLTLTEIQLLLSEIQLTRTTA